MLLEKGGVEDVDGGYKGMSMSGIAMLMGETAMMRQAVMEKYRRCL
jgi:phosphoribosylaminoimidazole (AIR) synthetase